MEDRGSRMPRASPRFVSIIKIQQSSFVNPCISSLLDIGHSMFDVHSPHNIPTRRMSAETTSQNVSLRGLTPETPSSKAANNSSPPNTAPSSPPRPNSSPNSNANAVSSSRNRTEETHDSFKIQNPESKILPPALRPLHRKTTLPAQSAVFPFFPFSPVP